MSLKEVTYYTVVCDRCGKDGNAGYEYTAWSDKESALWYAQEWDDWIVVDPRGARSQPSALISHYCLGCWEWDEAGDARVPRAPIEEQP